LQSNIQIAYNLNSRSKTIAANLRSAKGGFEYRREISFQFNGEANWHTSCMTRMSQENAYEQSR
jgi:hypothetical protein